MAFGTADEKEHYAVDTSEPEHEKPFGDHKASISEGANVYGDVERAEQLGYVNRGLKSRHVQFIALGGTIGTGLFLGIGQALYHYGPLSILLGYTITGFAIYFMMLSLGEMATWLPLPGAIPQMCARYVDPAMGFAVGWNQWYSNALTQCSEISAAASLIGFWAPDISPAPWIVIVIVIIVSLNVFAVKIYGEAEFWFASIKIITILGLLIFAFIIDLGGGPTKDRLGFRYWKKPGAMPATVASGNGGRFLSFFSTLVNAAFSYGGVESVAVAAGECENPRKNIPKAVKRIFWRILFFYFLGSLAIGVLVPHDNEALVGDGTRASPWVIAAQNAQVNALPSIINAVIVTSAISSGNAFLYTGSRFLYAVAQNKHAPSFFLRCNKAGVPYVAVLFTASISLLTFMSVSAGAGKVFSWFLNLTTISNLFTWFSILIASIRFDAALKAQGVARSELPFRVRFQPYLAWIALGFFSTIIIFNGWQVFTKGNWDVGDFVTAYIGIPIYVCLFVGWKLIRRTKPVKAHEADLWTGKAAIDNEVWPDVVPKNFAEKVWFWIA